MKKFEIFAGIFNIQDSYGSCGVFEFENEQEALEYAKDEAIEEYKSFEGTAFKSLDDIIEENELDPEQDFEKAVELYNEEMEEWLQYDVQEVE